MMRTLPQSDLVKSGAAKIEYLYSWIFDQLPGVEVRGDHRHRVPAQLFDLALGHGAAVTKLIKSTDYASAFALVRCKFECFVRGLWLHNCATDDEIDSFLRSDVIRQSIGNQIAAIEGSGAFQVQLLSSVKHSAWKAMNGYTHGGIHQISHRLQSNYIEPNFDDEALLEVLQFVGTLSLLAFGEIAKLAGRVDLVPQVQRMMDGGASTLLPLSGHSPNGS